MPLGLGLRYGIGAGKVDPLAVGRILDLDMTTGKDYSKLSITSTSAIGLVKGHDGVWVPKPAGYLAGLEGARVNGSAPAWDDGVGNPLSGVRWTGPRAATTTINPYSKPTPGTNGWGFAGVVTDGGDVPGPDGNATSARRISFSATDQQCYRTVNGSTSTTIYAGFIIKGTAGNKINVYYGRGGDTISWQVTLSGGWDQVRAKGAVSGTPDGVYLSINNSNSTSTGGTGTQASQTVDVFMLQISEALDPFIVTTGANVTRLSEEVKFPLTPDNSDTYLVEADFPNPVAVDSARLLSLTGDDAVAYISSSSLSSYLNGAFVGPLSTTISSGIRKIKVRLSGGFATGAVDSSIGTPTAFTPPTWPANIGIGSYQNGATSAAFTYPINKVKIWNRALSDTELTNA